MEEQATYNPKIKYDVVIGIDPDVERSGLAILGLYDMKLTVNSHPFPELLEIVRSVAFEGAELGHADKKHLYFLPVRDFTFSMSRYFGILVSIAFSHSHNRLLRVPLPFFNPACFPAVEMSVQGKEYVNRSKSGTFAQSIWHISPKFLSRY